MQSGVHHEAPLNPRGEDEHGQWDDEVKVVTKQCFELSVSDIRVRLQHNRRAARRGAKKITEGQVWWMAGRNDVRRDSLTPHRRHIAHEHPNDLPRPSHAPFGVALALA